MVSSFKICFFLCLLLYVHCSVISKKDIDTNLFAHEVRVTVNYYVDGANVTWQGPSTLEERHIFLVEFREFNPTLENASYVRMLSESNYKFIYNLRGDTYYVVCVHLGRNSGERLIDKNCVFGKTLTHSLKSPFIKQTIFRVIVGVLTLLSGFILGYAAKRFVFKERVKETYPQIPRRSSWMLPASSPITDDRIPTFGAASSITIQDPRIKANRNKSLFVKNEQAQAGRPPLVSSVKNCRSLSLPSIQKAYLAKVLNINSDSFAEEGDYESNRGTSFISYSSTAVQGFSCSRGTSLYESNLNDTLDDKNDNTQIERL